MRIAIEMHSVFSLRKASTEIRDLIVSPWTWYHLTAIEMHSVLREYEASMRLLKISTLLGL